MDGLGISRRQDPMDDVVCNLESANPLPALASRAWAGKRKSVGCPEPETGGSRDKTIWPNPKSTRAAVAEAIGLGSRAQSSPANQFPLCLRRHPKKTFETVSAVRPYLCGPGGFDPAHSPPGAERGIIVSWFANLCQSVFICGYKVGVLPPSFHYGAASGG